MTKTPLDGARWIGSGEVGGAPILTKKFLGGKPQRAGLIITAMGFFEAEINKIPVSADKFMPLLTDFVPRTFSRITYPCRDRFTHRMYYSRYDVTNLIKNGENSLEIHLGNGWWHQTERVAEGTMEFGDRLGTIFTLVLEYPSGTAVICSDGSETWRESEIIYNQLFIGEVIGARHTDTAQKPVVILDAPDTELCEQIGTPDRVIRTILPRKLGKVGGRTVYDCGENVSGVVSVTMSSAAGSTAKLRFAENLDADGALDFRTTGAGYTCASGAKQIMTDTFISDGTAREYTPKFTWHQFRYFDVEGGIDAARALVIHSDTPVTAAFTSDGEGMNFLFDAYIRTQLDNMHGSLPSDCPHRERLGYTGDGQVCAETAMLMLDSREFYRKWIRDILDCQDPDRGHIQHTAPFMGGGGGPGGWGCAVIIVPYRYYKNYGDDGVLADCMEPMKKWVGYLEASSENDLVVREEEGGWCLGDWASLETPKMPEPFVNTCYFVKSLDMLAEMMEAVGDADGAQKMREMAEMKRDAIRKNYRDPDGHYLGGVQGCDAYAAWCGLEPELTAKFAAERYDALGYFDTGFLGTDILCEVLFDYGYADVAAKLFENDGAGTFLHMKKSGATTIWEEFDGRNSHCHPMFGACARQLLSSILGIRQKEGSTAYRDAVISPRIPSNLTRASGSVLTLGGRIGVSWEKHGDAVSVEVTIPAGMHAEFDARGVRCMLDAGRTVIVC